DEAELLRHAGEDEVGLLLRQVVQLGLAAEQEALAQEAARPERDLRLHDVVARARWVGRRIEEGGQALLLVAVRGEHHEQGRGGPGAPGPTARAARARQSRPAMIITMPPVAASRMAVPRSGCFITSSVGTAIMAAGIRSRNDQRACLAVEPW